MACAIGPFRGMKIFFAQKKTFIALCRCTEKHDNDTITEQQLVVAF
jgi:hypothetical protein